MIMTIVIIITIIITTIANFCFCLVTIVFIVNLKRLAQPRQCKLEFLPLPGCMP